MTTNAAMASPELSVQSKGANVNVAVGELYYRSQVCQLCQRGCWADAAAADVKAVTERKSLTLEALFEILFRVLKAAAGARRAGGRLPRGGAGRQALCRSPALCRSTSTVPVGCLAAGHGDQHCQTGCEARTASRWMILRAPSAVGRPCVHQVRRV